ncbi:MAG TPA: protein kinase, partial [Polyangiaceae bacterium]
MEEAPASIDRYAIDALLGEGGMGRVYRAIDPRLGRRVALKVLLAQGGNDRARAVARARMMREARAAAAFNHPNVVAVYDVGEFEGNPFIAMELVSGTTMRDAFQDAYLPQAQKLAWLLDVARGLGAAHRAQLVHRDVKPENVMITNEGVVKILDFGIARASEPDAAVDPVAPTFATYTARGVAVGTPQYMPPEQLNGEELDGRADQFAWGVMAWEAIAGVSPWGGKSGAQLITAVLSAPVRPLTEVLPNADPRLSNAIARALKKNREERFPSMEALIAAIEGESQRAPSPASSQGRLRDPPPTQDTGRALVHATKESATPDRVRRRRRWAMGAGGLAGVTAAILWFAFHGPVATTATAAVAAAPPDAALADPGKGSALPPEVQAYFDVAAAAEREGRQDRACDEYQRASAAYPASAESALHVAICLRNDATAGRAYFRRAWALRGSLSPRDAAVLDAFEPLFQRDPVDLAEQKTRLEAAVARFPNDAPLRYYLAGLYRLDSTDIERAVVEIERSLALDPNQPHVLAVESDFHAYDGDFKGAHAAIDRCLRLAPSTLECLQEEQWLDSEEGECGKMESAARRMLAIDPSYAAGVHALANAVFAREGTVSTVRELLKRTYAGGDAGAVDARVDEARMAILAGDFAAAEKLARGMWNDARSSDVATEHAVPARLLLSILHESGRDAEAANVAE